MYTHADHASENDGHAVAHTLSENRAAAFQAESASLKKLQRSLSNGIAAQAAPIHRTARQKTNQPAQLFRDVEHAAEMGTRFRTLTNTEHSLNDEITTLLQAFQDTPSAGNHEMMMEEMEAARTRIKALHVQMVTIVDLYEAAPANQQRAYFRAYLEDKLDMEGDGPITSDQIEAIFNSVMAKTEALMEEVPGPVVDDEEEPPMIQRPMTAERSRFLMYMMQGLHDDMGVEQYRALDVNLGNDGRRLKVGRVGPHDMSGGMEDRLRDEQYANKTDDGETHLNDQDWTAGGGTGVGFLRSKFSRPYVRGQNPQRGLIGDMQINMDKDDELMPIFTGLDGDDVRMFSPPKKMAVHHEIGHVNSMLEGRGGSGRDMTGNLIHLTDQEEMYNIWGGPRSDRAYGEELGLPLRFNHTSNLNYTGEGSVSYRDFGLLMNEANAFNSPNKALGTEIKRLVDSNWRKITKGVWFKPDGVKEIKTLIDANVNNPNLAGIRDAAIRNRDAESKKRHPFTRDFYAALADIDPADPASISNVFRALRPMVVPQQWD